MIGWLKDRIRVTYKDVPGLASEGSVFFHIQMAATLLFCVFGVAFILRAFSVAPWLYNPLLSLLPNPR